jgi:hypothetical protein
MKTKQPPTEAKQEPVLISYDEWKAQQVINEGRALAPVFQNVLDEYHAFGFKTKITKLETLQTLIGSVENFITNERLKDVPETMNGLKIDRYKFLKEFVTVPLELDAFYTQVLGGPKLNAELYVLKNGKIEFNEDMVPIIIKRHQVWTDPAQTEAYHALQELADVYLRLNKLGYEVGRLYNMFDYRMEHETGKPAHFAFDPKYSLRAKNPAQ